MVLLLLAPDAAASKYGPVGGLAPIDLLLVAAFFFGRRVRLAACLVPFDSTLNSTAFGSPSRFDWATDIVESSMYHIMCVGCSNSLFF